MTHPQRVTCSVAASPLADVLIAEEVAQVLRCSCRKVYELIYAGKLHAVRPGRRFIVPRSALTAYLNGDPESQSLK